MNFYSLDGTKVDSNNLFENKQIYERFENIQNKSSSLDNSIDEDEDEDEAFSSIPTTKSNSTDSNYQCSDGYAVKGTNLGKEFKNSNLVDCKTMCVSAGTDCIGFNFNTKNNVCRLMKNATSMDDNKNSTLCIKKSAGNVGCKVNINNSNSIKAFNELDSIFNDKSNKNSTPSSMNTSTPSSMNTSTPSSMNASMPTQIPTLAQIATQIPTLAQIATQIPTLAQIATQILTPSSNPSSNPSYPMEIPVIESNQSNQNMNSIIPMELQRELISNTEIGPNMGNNPSGVYVDLDCFMKNINVLQNHSDNMMIDLSLLLSNIKNCSYIKKSSPDSKLLSKDKKMDSKQLLEQITSKINIPQPDTVQLKNIKADILVSTNNNSPLQILEMAREPFESENKSGWEYKDLVLVIIIVVLIYLLIFRK
jgi:hypothetical protein